MSGRRGVRGWTVPDEIAFQNDPVDPPANSDENPEVLQGVVDTVGSAVVEQVGEIDTEASKPGGAVGELSSGVGESVGNLGDTLTSVTGKLNPKRLVSRTGRGAS